LDADSKREPPVRRGATAAVVAAHRPGNGDLRLIAVAQTIVHGERQSTVGAHAQALDWLEVDADGDANPLEPSPSLGVRESRSGVLGVEKLVPEANADP